MRSESDDKTKTRIEQPVLSVVIFAYGNEDATILRSVASVEEQDYDAPFEVIVATSGDDRAAELVRQAYPQVRVIESPVRLTPGGMQNMGIEAAHGAIVAFLESGSLARPGWIKNRVAAHHAGNEAVVGSVVAITERAAARADTYLNYGSRFKGTILGRARALRRDGMSYTRELLDRIGPFDEATPTNEDAVITRRLVATGVDPWFEPSVCIEVPGSQSLRELLREQAALGRREARSDVVSTAPGSLRLKLQSRAPRMTLASRTVRHAIDRCRVLAANMDRTASPRGSVMATVPWIVLGLAANAVGWSREQRAYDCTGSFTELDGAAPTSAPLRRMTTTSGEKTLVLTFDDGPSEYTARVLRVLAERDVPATFFALGERAAEMPHVVRSVTQAGHEVASHGWSHTAFTDVGSEALSSEICRTQDKIRELTGHESLDVRPPYGRYDGQVVSWLNNQGLVTWLWTADARDYEPGASVDQIVRNTLLALTPGGIVLMHDGGGDRSRTVQALPRIIDGARARGFRFVPLHDVRVPTRRTGYRRQP